MNEVTITREQLEAAVAEACKDLSGKPAYRLQFVDQAGESLGSGQFVDQAGESLGSGWWAPHALADFLAKQLGLKRYDEKVREAIDDALLRQFESLDELWEGLAGKVTNLYAKLQQTERCLKAGEVLDDEKVHAVLADAPSDHPWSALFDAIFTIGARRILDDLSDQVFDAGLESGDVFELIDLLAEAELDAPRSDN